MEPLIWLLQKRIQTKTLINKHQQYICAERGDGAEQQEARNDGEEKQKRTRKTKRETMRTWGRKIQNRRSMKKSMQNKANSTENETDRKKAAKSKYSARERGGATNTKRNNTEKKGLILYDAENRNGDANNFGKERRREMQGQRKYNKRHTRGSGTSRQKRGE